MAFDTPRALSAFQKQGSPGMIGLWNLTVAVRVQEGAQRLPNQTGAGVKLRRQLEDGSSEWTCCDRSFDLYSMSPWAHCLDVEQVRHRPSHGLFSKQKERNDDGGSSTLSSSSGRALMRFQTSGLRFPDGSPVFQLKHEPAAKIPTWPRSDDVRINLVELRTRACSEVADIANN
jgi:hypothetical protein